MFFFIFKSDSIKFIQNLKTRTRFKSHVFSCHQNFANPLPKHHYATQTKTSEYNSLILPCNSRH